MELTHSFPPANAFIEFSNKKLKEFDYIQFGEDVIKFAATVSAIVVAVVSYVWTAFQLWWLDNGETVKVNTFRFVVNLIDAIAAFVIAIPKVYRSLTLNLNRLVDYVFYQVAFN